MPLTNSKTLKSLPSSMFTGDITMFRSRKVMNGKQASRQRMFQSLVMFFGITNSPATFQSMMNELFKDLIDTGLMFIYMDDILITTKMMEQHRELIKKVLQCLKDNNLFLKPEKCDFEKRQMDYLGLILKPGHIAMDPINLQGIADWPVP